MTFGLRRGGRQVTLTACVLGLASCATDRTGQAEVSRPAYRPVAAGDETALAPGAPGRTGHLAARVLRRTRLRASPNGRVVATIGRRTEYRSPRFLSVVRRLPG